jgi:hypothetical protein
VIENYSQLEVPAMVTFLQVEGISWSEIHHRLVSVYGQNVFCRKEVYLGCNKFNDGRTALSDDPGRHRSRPRTSHTDENCVIVKGFMRDYQRVEVHEIAEVQNCRKYCS